MKSNTWRETTLGELADFINGDRGKNYPGVADRVDVGIPFINTGHILPSGRLTQDDMDYITSEKYNQLGSGKVRPGDIVYCLRGSTIGKTARNHYEEGAIASSLVIVRAKPEVNQDYLYYFLTSPAGQQLAKSNDNGSAQPNLSAKTLSKYPLLVPSFEEQQSIVNTLNAIDNKIEVNTKLNQTLEEMAQAIFKSWFVDFDPVKAKMNGVQPEGMDEATASLFPEKLVESELGLIPEGWEITTLKTLSEKISKGTTPSKKDLAEAEDEASIRFIKVKDINDHGEILRDSLEVIPNSIHLGKLKRSVLETNDILFSIAGTIGRVATVDSDLNNVNTNQAVAFIRLKEKERFLPLVYMALRESRLQNKALASIVQGVQANLSLTNVGDMEVVVPSNEVLELWNKQYSSIFKMIKSNFSQSRQLSSLRDTLLPKLLSGEIELGQAQELSEVE